jgi:hypothetical protein
MTYLVTETLPGEVPGALDLFGVLTAAEPTGTIVVNVTSLPIDVNRQNATGSGRHQHMLAPVRRCRARTRRSHRVVRAVFKTAPGDSGDPDPEPSTPRRAVVIGGAP